MPDTFSSASRSSVARLALKAGVLVSIRGGLSVLGAVAAVLLGAPAETVLLGWATGAMLVSIILAGDRRGPRSTDPEPLPRESIPESWAEIARTDIFPSTAGVAVMTLVSLAFNTALAGLMAGILGGMAAMTIVSWVQVALAERRLGGVLYVERGSRRLLIRTPPQEGELP